jgi:hypothetical protein
MGHPSHIADPYGKIGPMHSATAAARISGLSYRRLDYVLRKGGLTTSGGGGQGRGSPRWFGERDLLALSLARELLNAGIRTRRMLPLLKFVQKGRGLPPLEQLSNAVLVTDGRKILVVQAADALMGEVLQLGVAVIVPLAEASRRVLRGLNNPMNEKKRTEQFR